LKRQVTGERYLYSTISIFFRRHLIFTCDGALTPLLKSAVPAGVKSILLPTIPLSPLQEIPSHASSRKPQDDGGSGPTIEPTRQVEGHGGLYPHIPATLQNGETSKASAPVSGLSNLQNPFASTPATKANETKVTLKTEEEQQAAAREREEKEKREAERNEILQRRDARRKSLGNLHPYPYPTRKRRHC
jgi:hypothetical protein